MTIALFALAVLMIIGGIASVIQGFPFVRLESGMAMTVAGATIASAGAVLLGLAVVARQLQGLGRRLSEDRIAPSALAEGPAAEVAPARPVEPSLSKPVFAEPAFSEPALDDKFLRLRPSLGGPGSQDDLGGMGVAAGAGLATAGFATGGFGAGPHGRGTEPTFVLPPDPEPSASETRHPEPVEPLLPNLLPPAAETAPVAEAEHGARLDEAPVTVQDPHPTLALFEPDLTLPTEPERASPSLDVVEPKPEPIAEPAPEPEPRAPAVEHDPDVVGTYKSGSNTYVMFSNGVIEADTPRGRFSFGSLDELKAFVAAGGETDARGAA